MAKAIWRGALALAALGAGIPAQAAEPAELDYQAITHRVAGAGLNLCRSAGADGTAQPCLPAITLHPAQAVDGWGGGGRITYTHGAVTRLSADAFALLAGHELAHWYLGHRASTRENEDAADRLGAALACRAGFDLHAGVALFRHVHETAVYPAPKLRVQAVLGAGCEPAPRA